MVPTMIPVTDTNLISQLEGSSSNIPSGLTPVNDPVLLGQLEASPYSNSPYPKGVEAGLDAFNAGAGNLPQGILQSIQPTGKAQVIARGLTEVLKNSSPELSKAIDIFFNRSKELKDLHDKEGSAYQNAKKELPIAAPLLNFAGGMTSSAPLFAIPGVGEGAVARLTTQGLAQGLASGYGQYVPEGGVGSRLINTILGGTIGLAAGGVGGTAVATINKIANARAGKGISQAAQEVIDAGEKHGVPVYAPDVSTNPAVQATGKSLEEVPIIGMNSDRKVQMNAAQAAAQKVTDTLSEDMTNTPYGGLTGLENIQEAAQGSGGRAKAAQQILKDVNESGDDWNRIVQTSGNVKLFRAKLIADKKYGHVAQLADKYGDVDTGEISSSIGRMIAEQENSVIKNPQLLGTLREIKDGLTQKVPGEEASSILGANGLPIIPETPAMVGQKGLNYSDMLKFRSDLSSKISDYFTGANQAIGKKGAGALQAIKNDVDRTLNGFAQANGPELKTAWKNADNFYRGYVAPAKDRLLASSLKNADPDTIYGKWIMRGDKKDRATRFYNSLDEKGRAAIRYGMVSDAVQAAQKSKEMFSPGRMAAELEKVRGARGAFFKGADKAEMDGFSNLMRHVDRSYQTLNKPDTGIKAVPWLITGLFGAGTALNPAVAATAAAGTWLAKKMMTSRAGRNFLLTSSRLQPGSPKMTKVIENYSRIVQPSAISAGVIGGNNLLSE